MNERVWPSLLGGKLTIFKIPFKKTLLATLIVTDSVDKVSHFTSLTRLRDFSIKSHEIYETFETLKT